MKLTYKPLANPLLILSDSPSLLSGLSRAGRDIASLAATLPQFRVGYLGRGGFNQRKFPWHQVDFPESAQWGEGYLERVWNDFSGGEPGVILSNWDLSRLLWFTHPQGTGLEAFAGPNRNFQKWVYSPVDSTGPNGQTLSVASQACLHGFDRACVASEFGCQVMRASGRTDADWLPHGLWLDKFHPYANAKALLGGDENGVYVGANMTNQARKDMPAAFECAAALRQEYGSKFKFWLHTDVLVRYWNVYALAADYGVQDCLEVTTELTDEQLAVRYSACDCTVNPTAGEGFSYVTAESQACGTACVVTDYAAGAELVEEDCRVLPVAMRVDTQHNVLRAVLSGYGFAAKVKEQVERKRGDWEYRSEQLADRVSYLGWEKLKHPWTKWLLEGLK
jgi:glycosyltransferase involved in cell wall biosynthesis